MISMNRPSRGDSWSATTMRYSGSFLRPTRRRRIRVAMSVPGPISRCAGLTGERSTPKGELHAHPPGLSHALHDLLHLLELREQRVHFLHRAAGALRDPEPALPVDEVRVGPFLGRHREHDGLDVLEL